MLPTSVLDFLNGAHGPLGMALGLAALYLLNRFGVHLPGQVPAPKPAPLLPAAPAELLTAPAAGALLGPWLARFAPVLIPLLLPYLLPYLSRLLPPAAPPDKPPAA